MDRPISSSLSRWAAVAVVKDLAAVRADLAGLLAGVHLPALRAWVACEEVVALPACKAAIGSIRTGFPKVP